MTLRRIPLDEAPMDNATLDFVRAGTLEELKAKGRLVVHAAIDRSCLCSPMSRSSRSIIAVRIWVSHWNVAPSTTASSPATGIMRGSK